jgi:phosphocarrier protein
VKEQQVTVTNPLGVHARPAALIVQTASRFACEIFLIKDGRRVNGKSMLGVMTLAAEMGSTVTIQADGSDEDAALTAIAEVFSRRFDEG